MLYMSLHIIWRVIENWFIHSKLSSSVSHFYCFEFPVNGHIIPNHCHTHTHNRMFERTSLTKFSSKQNNWVTIISIICFLILIINFEPTSERTNKKQSSNRSLTHILRYFPAKELKWISQQTKPNQTRAHIHMV